MDYSYQVGEKNLNCASFIGLTPIHLDGCMIMVWTEGIGTQSVEEKKLDDKKTQKDIGPKPGNIYMFIPMGIMVNSPWKMVIYAGGFCFGSKIDYLSAYPKILCFQNHILHYFLFCSHKPRLMCMVGRAPFL